MDRLTASMISNAQHQHAEIINKKYDLPEPRSRHTSPVKDNINISPMYTENLKFQ